MKFWDMASGHLIMEVSEGRMNNGGTPVLALSPDNRWAAMACEDNNEVRIRDTGSGEVVHTLRGHAGDVCALAFSPDGGRLVSSGMDRTLKVWDTTSGLEVITLRGHTNRANGVAFSPDGQRILSMGMDGTVRIWDATPTPRDLPNSVSK